MSGDESDWLTCKSTDNQHLSYTVLTVVMLDVGFLGALCGEEIVRLCLGGLNKYWNEFIYHTFTPHIPITLTGRFKNETGVKFY